VSIHDDSVPDALNEAVEKNQLLLIFGPVPAQSVLARDCCVDLPARVFVRVIDVSARVVVAFASRFLQ
jgi:hypothetical protein